VAVDVIVVIRVESNIIVICELAIKFDPLIVTVEPTFALVGTRLIDGTVTVKTEDAVLLLASVAITVLSPAVDEGTLNNVLNAPALSVVIVEGVVDKAVPPNVIPIFEVAAKPFPDTVTIVFFGP
jgi:hypothetical protein